MGSCSKPIDTVDDLINNKEEYNIGREEEECGHGEISRNVTAATETSDVVTDQMNLAVGKP